VRRSRELWGQARYVQKAPWTVGHRREIHRIVDIPPELPKPPEVLPKSPPPVVFVFPKPGLVEEPKPIPREDWGKLWIRAEFHGSPAAPVWRKRRARDMCDRGERDSPTSAESGT
jgi:hypothetical protein